MMHTKGTGEVIWISGQVQSGLESWAQAARPEEACGVLFGRSVPIGATGSRREITEAARLPNLAFAKKEARFVLDPAAWVQAERSAQKRGLALEGFWHSHPDGQLVASRADEAAAWEASLHIIVVSDGRLAGYRSRSGRLVHIGLVTELD